MRIKRILAALLCCLSLSAFADRVTWNMNPGWFFHLGDVNNGGVADLNTEGWDLISLPHTIRVFPYDLNGFDKYGRSVGWYRKTVELSDIADKSVLLQFQGAMQTAEVFVNGQKAGSYAVSGYDSFSFDITPFVTEGANLIAVRVDNSENKEIPPDGIKHDFILFGGLYRDVFLEITDKVHITYPWEGEKQGIRIYYPEISAEKAVVAAETGIRNTSEQEARIAVKTEVIDRSGKTVASNTSGESLLAAGADVCIEQTLNSITQPNLWSPDSPYLYTVKTTLLKNGTPVDSKETRIGLRWTEWTEDKGFFLNGKHLKLVGTNRHQNWPYIGGALPDTLHRADAEQLKSMGINWVRLSHYPHDPDFLDDLDELGLMALEEGPTWMRRGRGMWMENLTKSFTSMIRRDRNHPSIIIWNACINHETSALPELVAAARKEDPTRVLGQEDIYCPMDFMHGTVSEKALTLEHTGHMFPTTRGERNRSGRNGSNRELDHARRHMEMIARANQIENEYGLASWCAYDYNTYHNSQKAVARHGICDLFRIPKFSYFWHQSEFGKDPMTYIVRENASSAVVFTNAEQVRLYAGAAKDEMKEVATQEPDKGISVKHPFVTFRIPENSTFLKAEGITNGKVMSEAVWSEPGRPAQIKIEHEARALKADGSDLIRLQVSVLDENGMIVEKENSPLSFSIEGHGQLIGENPVNLVAGQHIILVQSGYVPGELTIQASACGLTSQPCVIKVVKADDDMLFPVGFNAEEPTKISYEVAAEKSKRLGREKVDAFSFEAVTDAEPGAYVESSAVLLSGFINPVPIKIKGGEYRIYVSEYTDQNGEVQPGDAVFVRVKASETPGKTVKARVTIGNRSAEFKVTTKK